MADIELVIKISEEDRDRIKDLADVFDSLTSRAYKAIRNGTPLSKKHGRLIDADELIDYCKDMIRIISESDDDMINIITSRGCYTSVIGQIINLLAAGQIRS